MVMMDPRRLRLLLELSRRGSMRAVADELGYTTSTVSQQLAVLSREAGATLLEREGRRVRLTPAGRRLAEHAVEILAAEEDVVRLIASLAGFDPSIAHHADSLELVEDLIAAQLGVGLLPADHRVG